MPTQPVFGTRLTKWIHRNRAIVRARGCTPTSQDGRALLLKEALHRETSLMDIDIPGDVPALHWLVQRHSIREFIQQVANEGGASSRQPSQHDVVVVHGFSLLMSTPVVILGLHGTPRAAI